MSTATVTATIEKLQSLITVDNLSKGLKKTVKAAVLPLTGIVMFLFLWQVTASNIITSLGQFPGPGDVWNQSKTLIEEHYAEREKADKFYARQEARNAKKLAKNPDAKVKIRPYTGKATYFDQIFTSLYTVAFGFLVATLIAIPLGIVCGLSGRVYQAVNPIIQTFKPVSPLAWLPLVTMVVSALYISDDPMFEKSFDLGLYCRPLLPVAHRGQHHCRCRQHRSRPGRRQPGTAPVMASLYQDHCYPFGDPADLHRTAPLTGHRLDGTDRRRDAGPEPGIGKIYLG